jgi:hypothetical protein
MTSKLFSSNSESLRPAILRWWDVKRLAKLRLADQHQDERYFRVHLEVRDQDQLLDI